MLYNEDSIKYLRKMGTRSYFSQACQDLFVLDMLNQKQNGYYCEIGAGDPFESNNTFLLERNFSWKGLSVELDPSLVDYFNSERQNLCICHDATTYNYLENFKLYTFPKQIDYLSIDLEPAENTFKALRKIPFDDYRFSAITYEHESYVSGPKFMDLSREYLESKGYKLVIANVKCFGRNFEDWWIDPMIISEDIWKKYESNNIEFSDIFR